MKNIQKVSCSLLLVLITQIIRACPVCERQQPKVISGISHGAGPQDSMDYVIIIMAILIVMLSLYFSVQYLVRPGEKSNEHIKRLILK